MKELFHKTRFIRVSLRFIRVSLRFLSEHLNEISSKDALAMEFISQ